MTMSRSSLFISSLYFPIHSYSHVIISFSSSSISNPSSNPPSFPSTTPHHQASSANYHNALTPTTTSPPAPPSPPISRTASKSLCGCSWMLPASRPTSEARSRTGMAIRSTSCREHAVAPREGRARCLVAAIGRWRDGDESDDAGRGGRESALRGAGGLEAAWKKGAYGALEIDTYLRN